jgi:predicted acylesterase/phospholipase RssA
MAAAEAYTLSFSGAGHLLPYHLGVATRLLPYRHRLLAVAGSSAGAIAATVLSLVPHRLEEYSESFLEDRGHAFRILQQMLHEEQMNDTNLQNRNLHLNVCTTKCSDGKMHLFSFATKTVTYPSQTDDVLKAVQASCIIPRSFHPFDMFSKQPLNFANEEGVDIDGAFYVDGGIAAPVPPTPLDKDPQCAGRIEVSPISGPSVPSSSTPIFSIRPNDHSLPLLPFSLTTTRCQPFSIRPSVQNVRAFVVSMGLAKPQVLRDWYQHGMDDASEFVEMHWKME